MRKLQIKLEIKWLLNFYLKTQIDLFQTTNYKDDK